MTELAKFVGEKVRYDWYQTEVMVVINILKRNINSSDLEVKCEDRILSVKLPEWSESMIFQLSHAVRSSEIKTKLSPSKLEIKLAKQEGLQWKNLEGADPDVAKPIPRVGEGSATEAPKKPAKNWDAVVKDEAVDEEDALQELFRKIYSEGNDETRKAMNKSFSESNGTVLSTNWGEVGTDKVETKPPEGVEFRKWD